MKLAKYAFFLPLIFTVILAAGCRDEEDFGPPAGDPDAIGGCSRSIDCEGVAFCDNGHCRCPEGVPEIARGFCVQDPSRINFVTYDRYPGMIDTMIIAFNLEPFDSEWAVGDEVIRDVYGTQHNRSDRVLGIGGANTIVAYYKWPGDFETPVDTVWIPKVFDHGGSYFGYRKDGWVCDKRFIGRFTDRNTIEGNIILGLCRDIDEEHPMPEEMTRSHPVVFRRL